jgi:hypothetical protein
LPRYKRYYICSRVPAMYKENRAEKLLPYSGRS